MTARTHVTFAGFLYLLLLTTAGIPLSAFNAVVVAAGSVLPDIDTGASAVGKMLPRVTARIERRFGHRTVTHSLAGIGGLGLLLIPLALLDREVYVCFMTGYLSHPLLDTMTVHGVKLFYPFSTAKCVFPLEVNNPHSYRLRTGGRMDKMLALIFLLCSLPLYFIAREGYERFVRITQHNIEAAVRDYNEFSKDHFVEAEVRAYRMLTKEPLAGTFPVVGALDARTLVFKGSDGRLHTLGKPFQADYAAEYVVCRKAGPARSAVRMIDMSSRALAELGELPPESYFFGDLATSDKVSVPENIRVFSPVTGIGGAIRLNFATIADIEALSLANVLITKGILTIRTTAGSDSTGAGGPGFPGAPATAEFAFLAEARDSIIIIKKRGDTLHIDDVVARRVPQRPFAEELEEAARTIALLNAADSAASVSLTRKCADAEAASRLDSVKYAELLPLAGLGFVAPRAAEERLLAWRKKETAAAALREELHTLGRRHAERLGRLLLAAEKVRLKSEAEERHSTFRAPLAGVVAEIRRSPHAGKLQFVVVVRRMGH